MDEQSVPETPQDQTPISPTLVGEPLPPTVDAAPPLTPAEGALPAETPSPVADDAHTGAGWKKVSYLAPAGIDLPVEYAGRWWHGNSEHVLPIECAEKLLALPGFADLGEAPEPYNAQPCTGCGATAESAAPEETTPA